MDGQDLSEVFAPENIPDGACIVQVASVSDGQMLVTAWIREPGSFTDTVEQLARQLGTPWADGVMGTGAILGVMPQLVGDPATAFQFSDFPAG